MLCRTTVFEVSGAPSIEAGEALEEACTTGLETQVQTTVTRRNMHRLDEIAALCEDWKARMWSVFFLVDTGRALTGDDLTGDDLTSEEYEQVCEKLYEISKRSSFDIKTTQAIHYRRFLAKRVKSEHVAADPKAGVSDARGFVFVSDTGEIYPSGFLPVSAGNVRHDSLVDVYRNSSLFRTLRDADGRHGKCGVCEYRKSCVGSRARAYALTGDYLAEDPRRVDEPSEAALH